MKLLINKSKKTSQEKDWVNRFRLLYSKNHLDLTGQYWHNNKVFDTAEYMTYGASVFYSRMKLTEGISINVRLSALVMSYSNDTHANPGRNGLIFTVVAVLD